MNPLIKEKLLDQRVDVIRLIFLDILGCPKYLFLPVKRIDDVLNGIISFDGSSVLGYSQTSRSDLYLKPDPESYLVRDDINGRTLNLFCSVHDENDIPFISDGRSILNKCLIELSDYGVDQVKAGFETEFYLFDENNNLMDEMHYFDKEPDSVNSFLYETIEELTMMGYEVRSFHHEVGPGQYEINYAEDEVMRAIEKEIILLETIREQAKKHKMKVDFKPYIKQGLPGNGLHLNVSLWRKNCNLISQNKSLSLWGKHFVNGILMKAQDISVFANGEHNSYLRLNQGIEAPRRIGYGSKNRSSLIRIPSFKDNNSARIEIRNVDSTSSYYLFLTLLLEAGKQGVITKAEKYSEDNTLSNLNTVGDFLPSSYTQAIEYATHSKFVTSILGEKTLQAFLQASIKRNATPN